MLQNLFKNLWISDPLGKSNHRWENNMDTNLENAAVEGAECGLNRNGPEHVPIMGRSESND
jgi:hypothetical protein